MKPDRVLGAGLRLLSLTTGWLIIVISIPLAFLAGAMPSDTVPALSPLLVVPLLACVLASGFLYVGIFSKTLRWSKTHRVVAGLLLAVPLIAGLSLLMDAGHQEMHSSGFVLLVPACIVFFGTVWPFCLGRIAGPQSQQ